MKDGISIEEISSLSDVELKEITENPGNYQAPIIMAAYEEIEKRETLNSNLNSSGYPNKPAIDESKNSFNKSIISLLIFVFAFYLIFKWDIKYILILVGVIFIHEIGHYIAMRLFKYKDLNIFFIPLVGAFASGTKDEISQKQRTYVLLAGPVPGIIIGTILYYFGLKFNNQILIKSSNIFIYLNLFNLLPILPLDGGNLIKNLFFASNEIINKLFIWLSIVILTYFSFKYQSYFLLIIPFFLLLQLNNKSQLKKVIEGIKIKKININKSYNDLTNEEYWLIREEIGRNMKYYERYIEPKRYIISDNEIKIAKQINSIVQKQAIADLKIGYKILIIFIWIMCYILPILMIVWYYFLFDLIKK
jgi:stage IV sporulation protein FB